MNDEVKKLLDEGVSGTKEEIKAILAQYVYANIGYASIVTATGDDDKPWHIRLRESQIWGWER